MRGSYCDINGGSICDSIKALTSFDSILFENKRINRELINQMKIYLKKGFFLGGGSNGHAYSILRNEKDYFEVRNPWSELGSHDKEMQKRYEKINKKPKEFYEDKDEQKNDEKKNQKPEEKLKNAGEFKVRENSIKTFFNHGIHVSFPLFGVNVYKTDLEQIGNIDENKKFYFSFEIKEEEAIMTITLHRKEGNKDDVDIFMDDFGVKLESKSNEGEKNEEKYLKTFNDFKRKALGKKENYNQFDFENKTKRGKHLGIINFNKKYNFKDKILTIMIDKHVNINFLGYLDKKPDNLQIENLSENNCKIKTTHYFYGEKTAQLREKFKFVNNLMRIKGYKIPDYCKGVYVETVFDKDIETIFVTDKKNRLKRCFTFDKTLNKFIYKEFDKDGNKIKEEKYEFNEIYPIKINDINQSERDPEISFANTDTERKTINYKNILKEDLNDINKLILEEENTCCFSNNINYAMKLKNVEIKFLLKGNIFNYFKTYCCCEAEIMKIIFKSNEKINDYISVKKGTNCCLCGLYSDIDVYFNIENSIKKFIIRETFTG